jgi:hypothetical protein
MKDHVRRAVLIAVCVVAGACTGTEGTVAPPTAAASQTETFTGTLAVGGTNSHNFAVPFQGRVNLTLVSATPPDGVQLGIGIGSFGSGTGVCTLIVEASRTTAPGTSPQISGVVAVGQYCLIVADVGKLTEPATYTVTVGHP